ncbi:MAG: DUF1553 domain-containing protein [Isosphaeraceae bacterium]
MRNIANRLWALMMGRGLVHPLDMDHSDNPPSHPELLDLLSREFSAGGYDVKAFLRELALTRTYQRSSEPPPGPSPSSAGSTEESSASPALAVASLKSLTPEQLAWSVMQGLGIAPAVRRSALQREKSDPRLAAIFETDARRRLLRLAMAEDHVHEQLGWGVNAFVAQFAAAAGQPQDGTDPTVQQALFLSNGEPVQGWLNQGGDRLVGRLEALREPSAVAEELYLSLLTRRPSPDERQEVERYLAERGKDRGPALRELAWALLASNEFRFNH